MIMANNKLLLALDVDGVHLDGKQSPVASGCWIGCKQQWIDTYSRARQMAENYDCELVFAIVTAKSFVDDLLLEQVKAFECFLQKHHSANFMEYSPSIWNLWNEGQFCAVKNWQEIDAGQFESDIKFYRYDYDTDDDFDIGPTYTSTPNIEALIPLKSQALDSYMELPDYVRKSGAIKRIAKAHDIPIKRCILVDDTSAVLQEAQQEDINIVDLSSLNTDNAAIHPINTDDEITACQNRIIDTISQVAQQYKTSLSCADADSSLDMNSSLSSTISISGSESSPSVLGKRSSEEECSPNSTEQLGCLKRSTP